MRRFRVYVPLWLFKLVWPMTAPIRAHVQGGPIRKGYRLELYRLLDTLLRAVKAETFTANLSDGGKVELRFDEVVGRSFLIHGGFEVLEEHLLRALALPGTTAIDVGANVGFLTVPMAMAVGAAGTVLAVEPVPENCGRLRGNLALNGLTNVEVLEVAASDSDEGAYLNLANDPAYHSLGAVFELRGTGNRVAVPTTRLDDVWRARGCPAVSVIKIDTEGTEGRVVSGATELITQTQPALLAEVSSPESASAITAIVQPLGYDELHPDGGRDSTRLYLPAGRRAPYTSTEAPDGQIH